MREKPRTSTCLVDLHLVLHSTIDQQLLLLPLLQQVSTVNPIGGLALLGHHGLAFLSVAQLLADKVLALGDDLAVGLALAVAGQLAGQTALGEHTLAALTDLLHTLHGCDGGGNQVAVVLDGDIALLGELGQHQGRVDDHLLATGGTVTLGPLQFAGLALHLEVLVTLGPTESELAGVIADECDALPREGRAGTEMAGFHTGKDRVSKDRILNLMETYRMVAGRGCSVGVARSFFLKLRAAEQSST